MTYEVGKKRRDKERRKGRVLFIGRLRFQALTELNLLTSLKLLIV